MGYTLGELIKKLETYDPDKNVAFGFAQPHSYRGYYDELAFVPVRNISIGDILSEARSAVGRTFTGYKGGKFKMETYTPVWLAKYGHCGETIGPILLAFMLGEEPYLKDIDECDSDGAYQL